MDIAVISADDHAFERPDTWTSRVPQRFRDDCPQVRRHGERDFWVFAGQELRAIGSGCAALRPDRDPVRTWDEVPEAAYVPAARLELMDADGVAAEVLFPQAAGFGGGPLVAAKNDPELHLACIRAYNDYLAEEWAGASPRFVAQALAPLWDVGLAVEEVKRAHRLGHKGLAWSAAPESFGFRHFNDPYWDPLWATCQELGMPVALHIGSSGSIAGLHAAAWEGFQPMHRLALVSILAITSNVGVVANLLLSGVLERFPRLNVISVESGLGWVPYLLETADHQFEAQRLWKEGLRMRPSEYFRRQVYVTFWFEVLGVKLRHEIGVENILWECDFPHPTSTYPNSRQSMEASLSDVADDERRKILHDNAARLYRLDSAAITAAASRALVRL